MNEIFELAIWTYPGLLLSEVSPSVVTDPLRSRFNFEPLELMDQSPSPEQIDVENLAISIREGEILTEDFLKFCFSNRLNPTVEDRTSALSYLGYTHGYEIAWFNVSYTKEGLTKLNQVAEFVKAYRAVVVDNHNLYCYRPSEAGSKPFGW